MVNLLLQSIIVANPHHDSAVTPEVRLAKAREALLGEKPTRGRKAIQDHLKLFPLLEDALKSEKDKMKRATISVQSDRTITEWTEQLASPDPTLRGIADEHAFKFAKPMTEIDSTKDWLRRAIQKLSVTASDMAELEGLFYGNTEKAKRLRRILEDLEALGIETRDPLGRNEPT
ncbi:hypothetical protein [Devosia marina]|uniref:hypothetical protein n=1 Tax=Devosia marina TaxID=2683198 RepID=UPI0032ED0712